MAAREDRVPGPGELDHRDGLTPARLVATIVATQTGVTRHVELGEQAKLPQAELRQTE
jgi:hypothetical protein